MAKASIKTTSRSLLSCLVVDVANLAHRNYHAMRHLTTTDGRASGHVYGSMKALHSLVRDYQPASVAFAYEGGGVSWRRKLLDKFPLNGKTVEEGEGYKRNRESGQDDAPVVDFVADVDRLFSCLPGYHLRVQGFEADDVIAAFVLAQQDGAGDVAILSGDRDLWQLVDDKAGVYCLYPKRENNRSVLTMMREADVVRECGVPPVDIPKMKATLGDASDNVIGVLKASRQGKSKGCQALALDADGNYFDRKTARDSVTFPEAVPEWLALRLLKQRKRLLANYKVCSLPYAVRRLRKRYNDALPVASNVRDKDGLKQFRAILSEFECRALLANSDNVYAAFNPVEG
jgi:hypothetical protein